MSEENPDRGNNKPETLSLTFLAGGRPTEDGWYLVKLKPEIVRRGNGEKYAVDQYRDGFWFYWGFDDIAHYAKLP